jgi:hypothetical protein
MAMGTRSAISASIAANSASPVSTALSRGPPSSFRGR